MTSRLLGWTIDACLVASAAVLCVCGWLMWSKPSDLVLLDRPREALDQPDMILRFVRTVRVPHSFRHGYLTIPATKENFEHLYRLSDVLSQCLDVVVHNQRATVHGGGTPPLAFMLDALGNVETFLDVRAGSTPAEDHRRLADLAAFGEELSRQF